MPADPLLNEKMLLETMRDDTRVLTPNLVRNIMGLVILGCYDRKVTREFLAGVLDLINEIEVDLQYIYTAGAMRGFLTEQDEKHPCKLLDDQIEKLMVGFIRRKHALADKFDLVSQCPDTTSPIS